MKFLIVEDDTVSRLILKKTLEKEGYDVIAAEDGEKGLKTFKEKKDEIYLAVIDWMMPKISGLELCKRIRKIKTDHYTYIIFLSAKGEKNDIVTGLEAGADDYLTKPFDPEELVTRVKVGLRVIELEKALKDVYRELEKIAIIDALTGILNRRALLDRVKQELHRSAREGSSLCLIMVDIDHFKKINDTYGHPVGDVVLKEIAARLKKQLRPYDIIGRYGGEEFMIAISKADKEIGKTIAERLRLAICDRPFETDDKKINVSISLGLACIKPQLGDQIDELLEKILKSADFALYRAKENGRNQVVTN